MFCQNCGNKLPDGTKFCSKCGASQVQQNVDNKSINNGTINLNNLKNNAKENLHGLDLSKVPPVCFSQHIYDCLSS